MKKVYLVILSWEYEYDNGVDTYVFDTLEKAQKKAKELVESELNNSWISHYDFEDKEIDDIDEDYDNPIKISYDDYYLEASNDDGDWTNISIVEKEIN